MGINKLWQLLRPSARTVKLESLKYRRLAIDASIWLTSFVKAMRDSNGNAIHNAHLKGLWSRLCKLLFFGMKPVFVFDGTPPLLKAETLQARRRARSKAAGELSKIAERILLNQLKLSTIAQAKQLVKEGKLKIDDAVKISSHAIAGSSVAPIALDTEENMSAEQEVPAEPQMPQEEVESFDELNTSAISESEAVQFSRQFSSEELRAMGASDSFVQDLPKEMQVALLTEMKAAHQGHVGAISLAVPKRLSGDNFSSLQVEQLVNRGFISRRLETVRQEIDSENYKPIASDPRIRYRITSASTTPIKGLIPEDNQEPGSAPRASVHHILGDSFTSSSSTTAVDSSIEALLSSSSTSSSQLALNRQPKVTIQEQRTESSQDTSISIASPFKSRSVQPKAKIPSTNLARRLEVPLPDQEMELVDLVSEEEEDDSASVGRVSVSDSESELDAIDLEQEVAPMRSQASMEVTEESKNEDEFEDVEFEDVDDAPPADPVAKSIEYIASSPSTPASPVEETRESPVLTACASPIKTHLPTVFGEHVDDESEEGHIQEVPQIVSSPIRSIEHQVKVPMSETVQDPRPASPLQAHDPQPQPHPQVIVQPSSIDLTASSQSIVLDSSQISANSMIAQELTSEPLQHAIHGPESQISTATLHKESELDLSLDSQRMSPVNQSTISEDDFQRHQQQQLQSFENLEAELQREVWSLQEAARGEQNQAATLTSEAVDEAKELLHLFGIPFVQSPSEADAQCAVLQMLGLVDGIVSDDSDILVFGGDTVFRYLFSQQHDLELYNIEDVQTELGLNHDSLIFLALLLGGDYADGVAKVGPKVALDIVTEFPGADGMAHFRSWLTAHQQGHEEYDMPGVVPPSPTFLKKYAKLLQTMKVPDSFPNRLVLDAYQNPRVDSSTEPFSWGWPDLSGLRQFALDKFGWTQDRVDANLLPIIQKYTSALADSQPRIETFFTQASIHGRKSTKPPKKTGRSPPKDTAKTSAAPAAKKRAPSKKRTRQTTRPDFLGSDDSSDDDDIIPAPKPPSKRKKLKPIMSDSDEE